jgi:outer membrane protein, multidrug efflux system
MVANKRAAFCSAPMPDAAIPIEAQVHNLDNAVAVAEVIQADTQVGISGVALLPSVWGSATAEPQRVPSSSIAPTSEFSTCSTPLAASCMLDLWGVNQATLATSEDSATTSRHTQEVLTPTTMVTVANDYFQVLVAHDERLVTRKDLAAVERIPAVMKSQFSQLDVSQQEALVATQRADIPLLAVAPDHNNAALAVLAPANFSGRGQRPRSWCRA